MNEIINKIAILDIWMFVIYLKDFVTVHNIFILHLYHQSLVFTLIYTI